MKYLTSVLIFSSLRMSRVLLSEQWATLPHSELDDYRKILVKKIRLPRLAGYKIGH